MKDTTKNNIVSGLKTATVVASGVLTLNSCSPNPTSGLSNQDKEIITKRTDSILNTKPDYRLSLSMMEYAGNFADTCRLKNKKIAKASAAKYIKKNIKDIMLKKFMMDSLLNNGDTVLNVNEFIDIDDILHDDYGHSTADTMAYIRRNYRWLNDLMLYLSDKYTPEQLLKSGFFKSINDLKSEKKFISTLKEIEKYDLVKQCASKRGTEIYNKTKQECIQEYKTKQR